MKRKIKKQGFTLIELLVVIVLIGVVMVVAVPAVRNLTYNSSTKQYNQLEKMVIEAAKLYARSYQGELTNASSDCFNIPYSTLLKESLIEEEKINCTGHIVLRKREKDGYDYENYLTCKDQKGKVVHQAETGVPLSCKGFSGNFKITYELYRDSNYQESYTEGNWEKYVYGVYQAESPYGVGIDHYEYSKDLVNWETMNGNKKNYTDFNGIIHVRAVDQSNNKSSIEQHLVRADSTGPSYQVSSNEHSITEDNQIVVSISNVVDEGIGVEENGAIYSFDGGNSWVTAASKKYAISSEGMLQVKDKLGNITTQPVSVVKACSNGNGTATEKDILSGKTAWVGGNLITGAMANQGAITKTLNPGDSYTIPAGYHNGSGKITVSNLASNTSATATKEQILSGQTAWVNGSRITGTMVNRGAVNQTLNPGASYTIPAGYHNGGGKITVTSLASNTSATATPATILTGYTAWVNGSKITGTMANRGVLNWRPSGSETYNVPAGYYSGGTLDSSLAYQKGKDSVINNPSDNGLINIYTMSVSTPVSKTAWTTYTATTECIFVLNGTVISGSNGNTLDANGNVGVKTNITTTGSILNSSNIKAERIDKSSSSMIFTLTARLKAGQTVKIQGTTWGYQSANTGNVSYSYFIITP